MLREPVPPDAAAREAEAHDTERHDSEPAARESEPPDDVVYGGDADAAARHAEARHAEARADATADAARRDEVRRDEVRHDEREAAAEGDAVAAGPRSSPWLRRLVIAVLVVAALLVLIRIVLDPIAAHFTHKALNEAQGIRGDFESVHVSVLPPGYEIRNLSIIEVPGGSWKRPLLRTERAAVSLEWRRLLSAELSARLRVEEPKIIYVKHPSAPKPPKKMQIPDVDGQLRQLIPARVDRIEVVRGQAIYRDAETQGHPDISVSRIEVAAENLATRPKLGNGQPATVSLSARIGKSGDLSSFVSVNPFADQLEFAGNAALRGLKLAELYDFEKAAANVQTPKGTLDLFAEFTAKNGAISGGVKPVLKNVEVRPTEDDLGNEIKAWVADTALDLFSDRVPGRNAVATVIPIKGRLDDPKLQVWPTIFSVIRNAFVQGIASGFASLPPATAPEKQNVIEQAADALTKDQGPAKAQPEGGGQ